MKVKENDINKMAQKTILIFEMINLDDDDYIVDPNSIFINGWLPNWQMLDEFLFKKEDESEEEILENLKSEYEAKEILDREVHGEDETSETPVEG